LIADIHPLSEALSIEEKDDILKTRKDTLSKVKIYIDNNLNPKCRNINDPAKDNFEIPKSIPEILTELNIEEEQYYNALSISSDNSYQIHFKRSPNSCFTNNYFKEGLLAWEANIDIQPVLDYYKAVAYMCAYLSKSEDESSEAMKQAAKESYETGKSAFEKMKAVSKAYRTHREMSIQEAVSIVLPEIWLRKTRPLVTFANSNLPEKRYRVCRSEEEIANMPEDETDIFKKNMLDRYTDRPNLTYKNGKYRIIDSLCYAEFLSNYTLNSKILNEEENDSQPEILNELLFLENSTLPKSVPLMTSKQSLKLRKTKCVLRCHVPNKLTRPEEYAHHLLFMFLPFRSENELKGTESGLYTEKLLEPGIIDIINRNKLINEPFGEFVEDAFLHFSEQNANGLDPAGEQENEFVRDKLPPLNIDNDEEEEEIHIGGAPANIALMISDDHINEKIRSLNKKQREIFNFINRWARELIKSERIVDASKPKSFQIFLTGSGGCGKSHLLTTIKQYLIVARKEC